MADEKLTIEELFGAQEVLQDKHDKAQALFQASRGRYAKAKQGLTDFNQKYGRMLKLVVVEAEQAKHLAEVEAEAKAQAEAAVLVTPDEVVAVEEIVNDPPVDTSAEE